MYVRQAIELLHASQVQVIETSLDISLLPRAPSDILMFTSWQARGATETRCNVPPLQGETLKTDP